MATTTTLDTLVVYLEGVDKGLQKTLTHASKEVEKTARVIDTTATYALKNHAESYKLVEDTYKAVTTYSKSFQKEQAKAIEQQNQVNEAHANAEKQAERMAKGKEVTVALSTNQEKYNQKVGELKELLKHGAISQETYNRGVKSLEPLLDTNTTKLGEMGTAVFKLIQAYAGMRVMRQAFHNFAEAKTIGIQLNATLEANGRNVEQLTKRYKAFAEEMERVTTAEDDAVLKMLQTAEMMGLTGAKAERAVKNAIALASTKGGSGESYVRQTALLEKGSIGRLSRLLGISTEDTGQGVLDDETGEMLYKNSAKVAEAQKILAKMFTVANKEIDTNSGMIKVLSRDYGNMLEDFGELIAEGVRPFLEVLKEIIAFFRQLPPEIKAVLTAISAMTIGWLTLKGALAGLSLIFPTTIKSLSGILSVSNLLKVGLIGGSAYGLFEVAKAAWNALGPVKELNKALEEGRKLTGRGIEQEQKRQSKAMERIDKLGTNEEKEQALQEMIRRVEKEMQGLKAGIGLAEKSKKEMFMAVPEFLDDGGLKDQIKELQERLRNYEKTYDELQNKLADVKESTAPKGVTAENQKLYDDDIAALERKNRVMIEGEEHVKTMEYLEKGLTDTEVAYRESLINTGIELEKQKKRWDDSIAFMNELANKYYKANLTAEGWSQDEIRYWELIKQGVDPIILEQIDYLMDLNAEFEHNQKLIEKGKHITEQYMTPQEKMAKHQAELNELLEAGAIDMETFRRATEQVKDETKKLNTELLQVQATAAGSNDAYQKIEEYRMMRKGMFESTRIANNAPSNSSIYGNASANALGAAALNVPYSVDPVAGVVDVLEDIRDLMKKKDIDIIEVSTADLE